SLRYKSAPALTRECRDREESCSELSCIPDAVVYTEFVKTLTVRLPEPLVAEIERESRGRQVSKSDIVRERLQRADSRTGRKSTSFDTIADLVGSVDGLPAGLSGGKKQYLKARGYGQKRPR